MGRGGLLRNELWLFGHGNAFEVMRTAEMATTFDHQGCSIASILAEPDECSTFP